MFRMMSAWSNNIRKGSYHVWEISGYRQKWVNQLDNATLPVPPPSNPTLNPPTPPPLHPISSCNPSPPTLAPLPLLCLFPVKQCCWGTVVVTVPCSALEYCRKCSDVSHVQIMGYGKCSHSKGMTAMVRSGVTVVRVKWWLMVRSGVTVVRVIWSLLWSGHGLL